MGRVCAGGRGGGKRGRHVLREGEGGSGAAREWEKGFGYACARVRRIWVGMCAGGRGRGGDGMGHVLGCFCVHV